MRQVLSALLAIAVLALTVAPTGSVAGAHERKKARKSTATVTSRPAAVGGYSYSYDDAVVEYRDRSILRDPHMETQDGPFDSGYFFDSNVTPYGSDAPYLN